MITIPTSYRLFHLPGRWRSLIQGLASLVVLAVAGPAPAQTALPEVDGATMSATGERTSLIRGTSRLRSTVDVILKNAGSKTVEPPLHAVVTFTPEGGRSLTGLTLPGASGGPGVAPYQTFFIDLTAQAPQGLAAGGTLKLPLVFERPSTLTVKYKVQLHGVVNRDPLADPGGPYAAKAGKAVSLDGSRSSDPDNDPLTLEWRFQDGSTAAGPAVSKTFAAPGLHEITLTATDGRGGESVRIAAVAVTPDGVFALGRSRVLDSNGHPLPGAEIRETGPSGERTFSAGAETGFASLGGLPGSYVWRFSAPGHLPVWRRATLPAGTVTLIPSPWLPVIAKDGVPVSLLEETRIASPGNTIALTFPAGAFPQAGAAVLTPVAGQALAAPLPPGWSPLTGFNITLPDQAPALPATLALTFSPAPPAGRPLLLVSYDSATGGWKHRGSLSGTGAVRTGSIPTAGPWAIALPDLAPSAPALPAEGEFLAAAPLAADVPAGVTATGNVSPAESAASTDPARVTAAAKVNFVSPAPLPSGVWFRTTVAETYDLRDGARFRTPDYDTTFFAWQGLEDNNPATLDADFPLRPRILLGGDVLAQAQIHVEVLPPGGITSAVFSPEGGELTAGNIRILIPSGASGGLGTGELRELDPAGFSSTSNYPITAAFSLDFAGFLPGSILNFSYSGKTDPLADYVLARFLTDGLSNGFQPVLRLRSNAAGLLSASEPSGELPGLDRAGQYALIKLPSAHGLVRGTVRLAPDNSPAPGASVRLPGQPWLAVTPAGGGYQLLAPAGPLTLTALRDREGFTGRATGDMPAPPAPQAIDIPLGSAAPFVVSTTPAAGALKVPVVTPLTLNFSERMQPGPFAVPQAIRLLDPSNTSIPATLSLDLSGRTATLLPSNPLTAATAYKITLSPDLRDLQNLALDGPREFTFTTAAVAARGEGAQLTIYEPGGAGPTPADQVIINAIPGYTPGTDKTKVVAVGGAGSADPEVAVILVNETTGTTATVLSKSDGSFANCIEAEEADLIAATFINANGSRVSIPANRQKYDDGRVGLFAEGGVLEAPGPGGPVTATIDSQTIPGRTVFRFQTVPAAEIPAITKNTPPENGLILGAVNIQAKGDTPRDGSQTKISFPIDPAQFGFAPGVPPESAALVLAIPQEVDGVMTYRIVDKLAYKDGRATTNSFVGILVGFFGAALAEGIGYNLILISHGSDPAVIRGHVGEDIPGITAGQVGTVAGEIAFGILTNTTFIPDVFLNDPDLTGSVPLPGAFVSARPAGAPVSRPGRVRAGMSYYTSERDGLYNLVLPFDLRGTGHVGEWIVEAIHPRHSQPVAEDVSFSIFIGSIAPRKNLVFPSDTALSFGSGAGVGLALDVALQPAAVPVDQPLQVIARAAAANATPSITITVINRAFDIPDPANEDSDLIQTPGPPATGATPSEVLRTDIFKSKKAMTALVRVTATVNQGSGVLTAQKEVLLRFGSAPPPAPDPQVATDPHDKIGPSVAWTIPGPNELLPAGQVITIGFSEPVNRNSFVLGNGAVTSIPEPSGGLRTFQLDANLKTLRINVPSLPAGTEEFTVTLGSAIKDLAKPANTFDQNAGTPAAEVFSLTIRLPQETSRALTGVTSGGGAVVHGGYAYVLDRAAPGGSVHVFDLDGLASGTAPKEVSTIALPAFPRDFAFIPDWSFRATRNGPVETKDLLLVVCGTAGVDENGQAEPQLLRIFDVSNPASPLLLRGFVLSRRNGIINRVIWRAPRFTYVESGSDFQFVGIVDLQKLLIGLNATPSEVLSFPEAGFAGFDGNQDGDYTDSPPDQMPLPEREPLEFYGKDFTLDSSLDVKYGTVQDVDYQRGTSVVVMAGTASVFRVLLANDIPLAVNQGNVDFGVGARARRVTLLPNTLIRVNGSADPTTRNLALVSLAPDTDGKNKLAVIDLSNPLVPLVLNRIALPAEMGSPGAAQLRDDGTVVLAMASDALLLETVALDSFNPILGTVRGAGTGGRTLFSDASGLNVIALGTNNEVVLGPPLIQFATFPFETNLVQPSLLLNDADALAVLSRKRIASAIAPARFRAAGGQISTLNPPQPASHFHVLIRAPGAAGPTLRVALESLNRTNVPMKNRGKGRAPVRTMSESAVQALKDTPRANIDAPISALVARRLSSDKTSALYNVYLSDPFAVIEESVTKDELNTLQGTGSRRILSGGFALRASIDPGESTNGVAGPFAGRVDPVSLRVVPGAFALAATVDGNDLPNPPPVGGDLALPNTLGSVMALNGEFRQTTVDIELPGARMPVVFTRTCAHAAESDDFGDGWDHFYNQRLVERDPSVVPQGYKKPLIIRDVPVRNKISNSGDVELINGEGRTILFEKQEGTPTEVLNDPMMPEAGILGEGIFYLPPASEPGVFDVLFQHGSSGEFTRVTPEGRIFRYFSDGVLHTIYDRYPENYQSLVYDAATGHLKEIIDKTFPNRFIKLYRFRAQGQSLNGLDKQTDNPRISGRVCAIEDYAGRLVSFEYDAAGRLTKRTSFETKSGKDGFSGRSETSYLLAPSGAPDVLGIIQGTGASTGGSNSGTAMIATATVEGGGNGGHPVTTGANGALGNVAVQVDPNNKAATSGTATHSSTAPDGASTEAKFDALGYVKSLKMAGTASGSGSPSDADAEISAAHDDRGRPKNITYEEGNSVEFLFDEDAENFRSRGNLLKITRKPGPRGGPTVVTEFSGYDPMYNVPTSMSDPNGKTITMTLREDKRDIEVIDYSGDGTHTIIRNSRGQIEQETTPSGVVSSISYNAGGFMEKSLRGGVITKYGYSADPNSKAHLLGMPTTITPPHGTPITVSYDNRLLIVKSTRGLRISETGYDENGKPVLIEQAVDAGVTFKQTRRYNQVGFLEESKIVGVNLGGGVTSDLVTTFTPDGRFRPKTITYPGSEIRQLTYDHRGHVVIDKLGDFEKFNHYDLNGNLTLMLAGGVKAGDITYDGQDRVTKVRKFDRNNLPSEKTDLTYYAGGQINRTTMSTSGIGTQKDVEVSKIDAVGRPKEIIHHGSPAPSGTQNFSYVQGGNGGLTTTISGPAETVTYLMDSAGRTVSRTSFPGTTTILYAQGNGNPTKVTSDEDGSTYFNDMDYNSLDHPISMSDGGGVLWNNGTPRLDGLLKSVTNGRGNLTASGFSQSGALLEKNRPENLAMRFGFDKNQQPLFVKDRNNKGHVMEYDAATMRPVKETLRDGSAVEYTSPDGRNHPRLVKLPGGGTVSLLNDPQGRAFQHVTEHEGTRYVFQDGTFDALGRLISVNYGGGAVAGNALEMTYDSLGPLVKARYREDGIGFEVSATLRNDGARTKVTYPDNVAVNEGRDAAGRLTSITSSGSIYSVSSFAGTGLPKVISWGGVFTETNTYDGRRRLTSRRCVRDSDSKVLADLRFEYDPADNVTARQFVHRNGRADAFTYDSAERLTAVGYGLRPAVPGATDQVFPNFPAGNTGLKPGLFAASFTYDTGGLDLLTAATVDNPRGFPLSPANGYEVPPVVSSMSGHDDFLFAKTVDGTSRGAPDPLGNAKQTVIFTRDSGAVPLRRMATGILHNGRGHLIELTRDDGIKITCQYQPGGLMHRRTVKSGNTTISDTALVWDNGRLIEERDATQNTSTIRARYFYDDRDAPAAADIKDSGGTLQRFYFIRSQDSSIVAVVSAAGNVVERVQYSAHGMPVIEKQDTVQPRIAQVEVESASSLLVHFSEPVMTQLTSAAAPALVSGAGSFNDVFLIDGAAASATWIEAAPGRPFGAVARVTLATPASSAVLQLKANTVFDDWGNANAAGSIPVVANGTPGTMLFPQPGTTVPDTSPERTARSAVGNPFLFHGQYFDYESGLLYLRARWYDPYTGTFLERDPMKYEDSVNLYAGMGNNPVSFRDPSGTNRFKLFLQSVKAFFTKRPALVGEQADEAAGIFDETTQIFDDVTQELPALQGAADDLVHGGLTSRPPELTQVISMSELIGRSGHADYQALRGISGRMVAEAESILQHGYTAVETPNLTLHGKSVLGLFRPSSKLVEVDSALRGAEKVATRAHEFGHGLDNLKNVNPYLKEHRPIAWMIFSEAYAELHAVSGLIQAGHLADPLAVGFRNRGVRSLVDAIGPNWNGLFFEHTGQKIKLVEEGLFRSELDDVIGELERIISGMITP